MAASSSSASNSQNCPQCKYGVFVCFRGADTRDNFTSHLCKGFENSRITTFLDDESLEAGDSISEELMQAIEESQVVVIVFSKNYATSSWCLNELVKIMKCKGKEKRYTVIPVFYYVDPSYVRYQSGSFEEAFTKHKSRYKDDVEGMQKVQGWRNALTAAAGLKGYDIHDGINQSKKIDQIVDHISSKLCKSASYLSDLQDIVGVNSHLEKLKSLLQIQINNVRMVGIWGTGGIGKTTIANAIFDTLSNQFAAACFLANVKENAKRNQLHSLQNTLLSELLRKKDDYVSNEYDGKRMIKRRLSSMKVLIVLDDIDHYDHLEYLAGDVGWFGNGSRVVVTTRNRKLIENNDAIYEVHTLPDHEAMQLFNQHAFKKEVPDECFKKFSLEVVNQAKGLPLALKVWGSMLHKKGVDKWKEIVDMVKRGSSPDIVKNLKISFEGFQDKEKTIFLDIACFFRGMGKDYTIEILKSYDLDARIRLDGLIKKSLVFISKYDTIQMHDLIQDMGRYVVKIQKDSGQPSRLWNIEDFDDVMVNNILQQFLSLRRIDLSYSHCLKRTPAFKGMPNLEYLDLVYCRSLEEVHPSLKDCKKLMKLNLSYCTKLERFPYVNVESLESLNLKYCSSLQKFPELILGIRELPLSFFDHQLHLTELNLSCMKTLVSLPSSICRSKGLVKLSVKRCSKLESLPEEIGDLEILEKLDARDTLISRPPFSIIRLNKLKSLTFGKQKPKDTVNFVFPQVNEGLLSLEILNLNYCNIIDGGLPEDIGSLSSLKELNLKGNNFEHLPRSISQLGALEYLDLSDCKKLTQLPEFPQKLHAIYADWSNDSFCNSLFQYFSSLQHDIFSSDSLSLRVCVSWVLHIPSWFNYQGMGTSVSVNLPENWYVSDNLLGFAVSYSGEYSIDCITAHLIPLSCDDGMSSMTQKFALSNNSQYYDEWNSTIFLLVPLGGLWDASNANEKTPNDYGCIKFDVFGQKKKFGVRLLYKDESELCIGIRKSRDEVEATCSSSKKQRQLLQLFPTGSGL